MTPPPTPLPRSIRRDGELSRTRLLEAALQLFAEKGYERTSTREIAEASGSNLAAISYYFGDKAGLYCAVVDASMRLPTAIGRATEAPDATIDEFLRALYAGFLEPLKLGDVARHCMRLHMREMIEPTGLWAGVAGTVRPMHDALVAALCRHFGLDRPDDDVRRLAICIAALGVHMHLGRDVTDVLAPGLGTGSDALDLWLDRLVMYAHAMVDAEQRRRAAAPSRRAAAR